MGSLCADQHKLNPCHQLFLSKKSLRQIDIPPRKLLSRRSSALESAAVAADMYNFDSPRSESTLLQKYLPYNNTQNGDDDDEDDPYSADHFRIYEFKVRRCTRSRSHDWTDCPFAHPGEKARRRDPRRYHYSGTVCPDFRRGGCPRGDNCEFAHGVFECWLHPARYRTEACKDGKNCKRKVCFFAHTPKQLRILPENYQSPVNSPTTAERKYRKHCCAHCHCVTPSPTSTLLGMPHDLSPPISPPVSPVRSSEICGFSPVSRFGNMEMMSYKESLIELMNSLESVNVNENSSGGGGRNRNLSWVDVSNFNGGGDEQQQQFVMSPIGPSHSGSGQFVTRNYPNLGFTDENGTGGAPDLGWVNDLLT